MKTLPGGLATHYAQPWTTVAPCLRITRGDGVVLRVTGHDRRLTIGAETFQPTGLQVSSIVTSLGLGVDNLELTVLPDDAGVVNRADILAGRWNNAAVDILEVNWSDPAGGVNTLASGTLGEARVADQVFTFELRSLKQALQQPVGSVTSKTCRYRLGDAKCTRVLTSFTHIGNVSSVGSSISVTDSARLEAAGYFAEGEITFTDGPAAGLRAKVKAFASGGVFTLALPLPVLPVPGNAYTAIAGCDKTLATCGTKFGNVLNFGGEPHLPGTDALTASPTPSV